MSRGGFRWDYPRSETDVFRIQGDAYAGTEYTNPDRSTLDGQNVLAHWRHVMAGGSAVDLRFYADRTWRNDTPSTLRDQMVTYDSDLQHDFAIGDRHRALWGAGFRWMENYTPTETPLVGFNPTRKVMRLASAFVQDEIALSPHLTWTVGSKFENTEYSGFEVQPSTRLAWNAGESHTVWAAVSRAVRAPSRIDVDYYIPKAPPYAIAGGPDFVAETVESYEVGWRLRPVTSLFLSIATYYNHYDLLHTVELQNPPAPLPYTIQNGIAGQSWGVEVSGTLQPAPAWRLRGGYTYFHKDLWSRPGHDAIESVIASVGNDPEHTVLLQSLWSIGTHVECDVTGRYVDLLPNPKVPSYVTYDARFALLLAPWELAVVGRNLWDPAHPEFYPAQEVPRSVHGSLTVRW
jgi:iron complex outermembrane receptor protein